MSKDNCKQAGLKRMVQRPPARPTGRRYNSVAELCKGEGLPEAIVRLIAKHEREHPDPDSKNFTPIKAATPQ